jgi:hypothetical protein
LAACGGGALAPSPTAVAARAVPFVEVAAAQNSRYDGGAAVMVGATAAAAATIVDLVPQATAAAGRVLVAAFQGGQRTGGYAIHIDAIERDGDRLIVRATFTSPAPGSIVTQVLTSPAHVVSVAQADASGVREVLLLDRGGAERARATVR